MAADTPWQLMWMQNSMAADMDAVEGHSMAADMDAVEGHSMAVQLMCIKSSFR